MSMGQNLSIRPSVSKVSAAVGLNTEAGYLAYFTGKSSLTTGPEASNNRFKKLGKIIRSVILTPKSQKSKDGTTGGKIAFGWNAVKLPQLWIVNNTTMSIPSVGAAPSSFSWSSAPQFSPQYLNLLKERLTGSEKPTRPLFSHYGNGQYMETLYNEYRSMLEPHQPRFLNILKAAAPEVHQAFVEWLIIHAGASVNNGLSEAIVRDLHSTQFQMKRAAESQKVGLTKDFIGRLKQSHPEQFKFINQLASVARNDLDLPQDQRRVGDMHKALAPWVGPEMASVLIEDYYQVFDVEIADEDYSSSQATTSVGGSSTAVSSSSYRSGSAPISDESIAGRGVSSPTLTQSDTNALRNVRQEYRDKGCLSLDTMRKMTPVALERLIGMKIIHEADRQGFRDLHSAIQTSSGFPGLEHVYKDEPTTFAEKTLRQCVFDHVENNIKASTKAVSDEVQRVLSLVYRANVDRRSFSGAKVSDVLDPRGLIAHVLATNGDPKTAKEQQRLIATELLLSSISDSDNHPLAEAILKVLVRPFIDGESSFSFRLNPIRRAKVQLLELAKDWADSAPVFAKILENLVGDPKFGSASILKIDRPKIDPPTDRMRSNSVSSGGSAEYEELDFTDTESVVASSVDSAVAEYAPKVCDLTFVSDSISSGNISDPQRFFDEIAELVAYGQTDLLTPLKNGHVKQLAVTLADNMFSLLAEFNDTSVAASKLLGTAVGMVNLSASDFLKEIYGVKDLALDKVSEEYADLLMIDVLVDCVPSDDSLHFYDQLRESTDIGGIQGIYPSSDGCFVGDPGMLWSPKRAGSVSADVPQAAMNRSRQASSEAVEVLGNEPAQTQDAIVTSGLTYFDVPSSVQAVVHPVIDAKSWDSIGAFFGIFLYAVHKTFWNLINVLVGSVVNRPKKQVATPEQLLTRSVGAPSETLPPASLEKIVNIKNKYQVVSRQVNMTRTILDGNALTAGTLIVANTTSGAPLPLDVTSSLNGYVEGQVTESLSLLDRAKEVSDPAKRHLSVPPTASSNESARSTPVDFGSSIDAPRDLQPDDSSDPGRLAYVLRTPSSNRLKPTVDPYNSNTLQSPAGTPPNSDDSRSSTPGLNIAELAAGNSRLSSGTTGQQPDSSPLPGGNLGGTFSIVPGVERSDHSQFLKTLNLTPDQKGAVDLSRSQRSLGSGSRSIIYSSMVPLGDAGDDLSNLKKIDITELDILCDVLNSILGDNSFTKETIEGDTFQNMNWSSVGKLLKSAINGSALARRLSELPQKSAESRAILEEYGPIPGDSGVARPTGVVVSPAILTERLKTLSPVKK